MALTFVTDPAFYAVAVPAVILTGFSKAGLGGAVGSLSVPLMNSLAKALEIEGDQPFKTGGIEAILVQVIIFLILNLVLYPLFGAIGGLLGAGVFWKTPQAAAG